MTDRHSHLVTSCIAALALGLSALTLVIVGLLQKPASVAGAEAELPEILTAREFHLVDQAGVIRARLHLAPTDVPELDAGDRLIEHSVTLIDRSGSVAQQIGHNDDMQRVSLHDCRGTLEVTTDTSRAKQSLIIEGGSIYSVKVITDAQRKRNRAKVRSEKP